MLKWLLISIGGNGWKVGGKLSYSYWWLEVVEWWYIIGVVLWFCFVNYIWLIEVWELLLIIIVFWCLVFFGV